MKIKKKTHEDHERRKILELRAKIRTKETRRQNNKWSRSAVNSLRDIRCGSLGATGLYAI